MTHIEIPVDVEHVPSTTTGTVTSTITMHLPADATGRLIPQLICPTIRLFSIPLYGDRGHHMVSTNTRQVRHVIHSNSVDEAIRLTDERITEAITALKEAVASNDVVSRALPAPSHKIYVI
jgi:hypothetical protein